MLKSVVWRCDPASHGIPLRISAQDARERAPKPIPPPKLPDIEEVQQSVTQLPQELSIPTRPSTANTGTENYQTENISSERSIKLHKTESRGADLQDKKADIAWLTYPYQSKDIYTLKNRANKVKERVLNASTKGELVSLYAQGAITASEVEWLKSNLLSQTECDRLNQIEATKQTDLFNQDGRHERLRFPQTTRPHEHKLVKAQTTKEVRRIGWGKKQGVAYIKERYGVGDRSSMSIEQLVEFRNYLRTLPGK